MRLSGSSPKRAPSIPATLPSGSSWSPSARARCGICLENSNCLVAPSRGEGFGLPVAEAMLSGVPVIATIHGGHADLCSPAWCWPLDFQLTQASTHLSEGESLWAEPDADCLAARMRELFELSPAAIQPRTERARAHVRDNFTWAQTAERRREACARILREKDAAVPRIRRQSPRAYRICQ